MIRAMMLLCGLLLSSPALAQTEIGGQPTGEGDPDAITCRRPMQIPSSRMLGPRVCKKNAVWVQYREDRMMVSEDGTHDVPARQATQNCRATGGGSGGTGSTSMASGMGGTVTCN